MAELIKPTETTPAQVLAKVIKRRIVRSCSRCASKKLKCMRYPEISVCDRCMYDGHACIMSDLKSAPAAAESNLAAAESQAQSKVRLLDIPSVHSRAFSISNLLNPL